MSAPAPRRGNTGVYTHVWAGYSLQDRDRRWNAVRARAVQAGLDCVFVPVGDGINARYLTQFRASAVVLPADGRAPLVVSDRGASNAWVPEPRLTAREWAEPMAQALLDAGMERARIGVSGLRGGRLAHVSSAEGVVCHSAFAEVVRRLPDARFEDATDVLGGARYLKGPEELAAIRRAAVIAEAGLAAFHEHAAADEELVRARILGRMLDLGSEYFRPILAERAAQISAVWGTQVVTLIEPRASTHSLAERFEGVRSRIAPGISYGDLGTGVTLRGIGGGDDGPVLFSAGDAGFVFEPNTAFTLTVEDGGAVYGRPILITEAGAESAI